MTIKIRKLNISINTKFLSNGEEIFVRRLAKKFKKGKNLNSNENGFLLSMSRRSEAFSPQKSSDVKVAMFLN